MLEYLFSEYLENQDDYDGAVQFWRLLFEECLESTEREVWKPWLQSSPDGNPIFSVIHRERRKGISVHQEHYLEEEPYFFAEMRVFDSGATVEGPIEHLMILCELSKEIIPEARKTMQDFVRRG